MIGVEIETDIVNVLLSVYFMSKISIFLMSSFFYGEYNNQCVRLSLVSYEGIDYKIATVVLLGGKNLTTLQQREVYPKNM